MTIRIANSLVISYTLFSIVFIALNLKSQTSNLKPQTSNLLHKHEIDGGDDAEEGGCVVPVEALVLEHHVGDDGEDEERDALLYDLQLYEREGSSVAFKADAVGRHLTAVFEEGDDP